MIDNKYNFAINLLIKNESPYKYSFKTDKNKRLNKSDSFEKISFRSSSNIANGLIDKIMRNKITHKVFELAENNSLLFRMAYGCVLSVALRPLVIMAIPGAKKDDKKYAAVKSIASGIVSLLMAAVLFIPLEYSIRRLGKSALENVGKPGEFPYKYIPHNPKECQKYDAFQYVMNMGAGFLVAPLDAYLVFKLVPPVVDKLFPKKQEKQA